MSKNVLSKKTTYVCGGVVIVLVVLLAFLLINMKGKTEIYTDTTANEKIVSITCSGTGIDYPILKDSYDAITRKIDINAFFRGDKVTTLGLVHTWTYNNEEAANRASTLLSFNMQDALTGAGYSSKDALGEKFSVRKSQTIMNLYAENKEITAQAAPFFLIETNDSGQIVPKTKSQYMSNYKSLGFSCKEN